MTLERVVRDAHANAAHFAIGYPPGTEFAELMDLDAERSRIPAARYISREVLELEIGRLWKDVWQLACREDEISAAGACVTYAIADQHFLIVRQPDGSVKAFRNVCLHRGNLLRSEGGTVSELRCRFHRWCWDIDGTLQEVPDEHLFVSLDRSTLCLPTVPCETWAGFVFIQPAGEGGPTLSEFLGSVVEQLAPYRLERMVTAMSVSQPLSCNWKTAVETFLEVYHTGGIHPQLLRSIDDVNTTYEVLGEHSRMITPFGIPSMRADYVDGQTILRNYTDTGGSVIGEALVESAPPLQSGLPPADPTAASETADAPTVREWLIDHVAEVAEARQRPLDGMTRDQYIDDWHYFVFPGLIFNINPLSCLLLRVRPGAQDPDRCLIDVSVYHWPDPVTGPFKSRRPIVGAEGEVDYGRVLNQDFKNLPSVQQGLHSDGLTEVIMSKQEIRLVAFHEAIQRRLAD